MLYCTYDIYLIENSNQFFHKYLRIHTSSIIVFKYYLLILKEWIFHCKVFPWELLETEVKLTLLESFLKSSQLY